MEKSHSRCFLVETEQVQLLADFAAAEQKAFLQQIATDIVYAYACFNRVVELLSLTGSQIIRQVRDDIQTAVTDLLTDVTASGDIPDECVNRFEEAGFSLATFTSNTDVFDTAPSGC